MFRFGLIIRFGIILICLCYQRLFDNYFSNFWSRIKANNNNINGHKTLLHRTTTINNRSSTYLIIPQIKHYSH
jgi:hypothetical protein